MYRTLLGNLTLAALLGLACTGGDHGSPTASATSPARTATVTLTPTKGDVSGELPFLLSEYDGLIGSLKAALANNNRGGLSDTMLDHELGIGNWGGCGAGDLVAPMDQANTDAILDDPTIGLLAIGRKDTGCGNAAYGVLTTGWAGRTLPHTYPGEAGPGPPWVEWTFSDDCALLVFWTEFFDDSGLLTVPSFFGVRGDPCDSFDVVGPIPTTTPTTPTAVPTGTPSSEPAVAPATYTDPFTYCAAAGTVDSPDERWAGPEVPQPVDQFLRDRFGPGYAGAFWRCLDGNLMACTVGANLPCGPANASREPSSGMVDYCRENPEGSIPAALTGHNTVYIWGCQAGTPVIIRQWTEVDSRGFVSRVWYVISP